MTQAIQIKPKERDQLLQALRAGVVPRAGLRHVQVGRVREIAEISADMDRIAGGGTSFRIVVGPFGAGKTFFLSLSQLVAQEKRLVVMRGDLSPELRLSSSGGEARAFLAQLAKSMSTRTKPDGGALEPILQRFVSEAKDAADRDGTSFADAVSGKLRPVLDLAGGYDAVAVVKHYADSWEKGASEGCEAALRWLRAEFSTKTEARQSLPVREIADDSKFWDHLKILAAIVRAAGFAGLLVIADEMVNLYRLPNPVSRQSNYEEILRILNDLLQGSAEGIGVMMGGTPEFLMDRRKGLHSYEALKSRLEENAFAGAGLVDLAGPVIRLQSLTPEDMLVLLHRLREVYLSDASARIDLPEEAITAFMEHCNAKIGAAYFQTPRTTIRAFIDLMEVLRQNPGSGWRHVLGRIEVEGEGQAAPAAVPGADDDDLTSFRL